MRTGVIQPLPGIGDMIWFLPALQAIAARAPNGKITLFTKASSLADKVLAAELWVDEIVYLPKARGIAALIPNFLRTWWALILHPTDHLFIFHQSARYRLAAQLAGIRRIDAYPKNLACSKANGWQKSLEFLKQLEIPIADIHPKLAWLPEAVTTIRERFRDHPQPWFIVSAGASEATRCWPEDRFAVCVDTLVDILQGTVFLTGAPRESERIQKVYKLCRQRDKIVPVTDLPFDKVMGLMVCSAGIFGNDSGPINVMAALRKPAFALSNIGVPVVRHSPSLHFIEPDLTTDQASGMERISLQHALSVITENIAQIEDRKNQAEASTLG